MAHLEGLQHGRRALAHGRQLAVVLVGVLHNQADVAQKLVKGLVLEEVEIVLEVREACNESATLSVSRSMGRLMMLA